jgi:hypothetical protein
MPSNYVLLERIELNASAASVTFANIPQTGYTDLKIVVSARGTASTVWSDVSLLFNGVSTNFSAKMLYTTGNTAYSDPITNTLRIPGPSSTALTFGNLEIYVPNYTSSNYKSWSADTVTENNSSSASVILNSLIAGLWSNTAAITSVSFSADNSGVFAANSTFSLYGLAATGTTPAIAPKASGGNVIATDGTYWYHAFLSSGTFTPQLALTADVLSVAGGGTGGRGGGGAGGLFYSTNQSLTQTSYNCVVGAGGAARISDYGQVSPNGNNSQFAALTAAIGGGGGAGYSTAGANGGCGGGAGWGSGTAYSGGIGSQGGNGSGTNGNSPSGGGGGIGASASARQGGNGTTSYSSWLSATALGQNSGGTYYIGGGGSGGGDNSGSTGLLTGGLGGGGTGSYGGYSTPANALQFTSGTPGTGGGGGGGWYEQINGSYAGQGGSGIIIIRYPIT